MRPFQPRMKFGCIYQLYPAGDAHVGAAHVLLRSANFRKGEVCWSAMGTSQVGSAQEHNLIASLVEGLDANLRAAVEKLIGEIRTKAAAGGQ
jgi:hypothetical protein